MNTFCTAGNASLVINLEVAAPRYLRLTAVAADLTTGCAVGPIIITTTTIKEFCDSGFDSEV
jgi:hypothetical protein